MDAKQLAAELTGMEYGSQIPSATISAAKGAGLVIVYGASDDLMEFRGALNEEIGADDGTEARIDAKGLVSEYEEINIRDKDTMRDYFKRENGGKIITALWAAEAGYSWTYQTDIPHETFEVIEDGGPYCRGIVFQLADCA